MGLGTLTLDLPAHDPAHDPAHAPAHDRCGCMVEYSLTDQVPRSPRLAPSTCTVGPLNSMPGVSHCPPSGPSAAHVRSCTNIPICIHPGLYPDRPNSLDEVRPGE